MNGSDKLWGIDLGGTKIEGVVLASAENPEVLCRHRVPTEANQGYEHVLGQVQKLVNVLQNETGESPQRIGIGTPGICMPSTGLMKNCNATALNGKPMKADLEKLLGIEVRMANDANCFALAEATMGAVKQDFPDAKVVFGVILGTGVGGGVVVNGQLINGRHAIGGEWGHNYLPGFEGRDCFCGKKGDNESVLSGPSLEWYYAQQSGQQKPLKEIVTLAREGKDAVAVATLDRLIAGFGMAISVVVNILDPDVIVIGGGVGNISELYTKGVEAIAPNVFDGTFEGAVVKPKLGDSAGVFGAAFL
ncbi:ROK family protein [Marinoscillum furvescens]|uniref:N-acetylglucosamine kinase n=1 Tax=Marinoscillum furvescens DSM 4134 TaxID=1122208 RepID=A0A3D9L231_MARFU|nr:ROK family protein [Marinoscillum furvescens]RED98423.1 N-acetylglucosamine kinase [Marinoscillum furvescens DSM 4134]